MSEDTYKGFVYPGTNLGIARERMPQVCTNIDGMRSFIKYCRKQNIIFIKQTLPLSIINYTQKEIDIEKVSSIYKNLDKIVILPFVLDKDLYLLDNHHTHCALYNSNRVATSCFVANTDIYTLIEHAKMMGVDFKNFAGETQKI